MRIFRSLALALALATLAPLAGLHAQEMTKMTVSYSTTADFTPAFVAKDEGIFAKHGLDVTLTNLATTSLGPPALQSGSVQIASISPPLLLLANDGGLDLVAVETVAAMDASEPHSSIVTRPGFVAKEAKDFIGKKIARPGLNSAIDILLKKWMLDRNAPIDQVTFVEVPFPQMGDLLKAGQIDAAVELEPLLSRVIANGSAIKSIDFMSEISPRIIASLYGASRDWATSHMDAVKGFRVSLAEAMQFAQAHPDETAAIQKKYIGATGPAAEKPDHLTLADFTIWIDAMKQLKLLQQPVESDKLILP